VLHVPAHGQPAVRRVYRTRAGTSGGLAEAGGGGARSVLSNDCEMMRCRHADALTPPPASGKEPAALADQRSTDHDMYAI
jgi:hypothetical protein